MHNRIELLLFSFSVASSSFARAANLDGTSNSFTPNYAVNLFGQENAVDNSGLGALAGNLLQNGLLADLQFFTGALGGVKAPPITMSNNQAMPYTVQGNTFADYPTAASRACTSQFNSCSSVSAKSWRHGNPFIYMVLIKQCRKPM